MWAEAMSKLEGMDSTERERLWPQLVQGLKDLSQRLKVDFINYEDFFFFFAFCLVVLVPSPYVRKWGSWVALANTVSFRLTSFIQYT